MQLGAAKWVYTAGISAYKGRFKKLNETPGCGGKLVIIWFATLF